MSENPYTVSIDDALATVEQQLAELTDNDIELGRNAMQGLVLAGGKRMRPRFLLSVALAVGAEPEKAIAAATSLEMTHCGTLLQDDVIDASAERRGQPTAFAQYGAGAGVLGGNRLYTAAFLHLLNVDVQGGQWLIEALQAVVDGELVQQEQTWRLVPDESALEFVARRKTGSFFGFAAQVAARAAGGDVDAAYKWGLDLGYGFQLADDLLDFGGKIDKPTCKDLREGFQTLPVYWHTRKDEVLRTAIQTAYATRSVADFDAAYDRIRSSTIRAETVERLDLQKSVLIDGLRSWMPNVERIQPIVEELIEDSFFRAI